MEETKEIKSFSLDYVRRFGVEIEINAFDGKSKTDGKKSPEGVDYVGNLIQKVTNEHVIIHKWDHDHNNRAWIIKPDSSCGIEICSPVSKGWHGVKNICKVVEALGNDRQIQADERCSLHVHVEVSDMSLEQIASVLAWWIKCEPVFMDSVPLKRKNNKYCQYIGIMDILNHNTVYSPDVLIKKLGYVKYTSLNTFHLRKNNRNTIEFRIMENVACKDAFAVKNWIRLLLHFVEMTAIRDMPGLYQEGNQWSSWLWLDPEDVFEVLGFNQQLSLGLQQVRSWFLDRLMQNTLSDGFGIFSREAREKAYSQTQLLAYNKEEFLGLFDNKYRL